MAEGKSSSDLKLGRNALAGLVVGLVVLGIVGYFGWQWLTVGRFIETTNNAYIQSDITPISPKVAGYVTRLMVRDNQHVEQGDVLVRIDDREFQQQVAGTEAELVRLQADIKVLDERKRLQAFAVDRTSAEVSVANAELARTNAELERSQRLRKTGNTSRQNHDAKVAAQSQAQGRLEGAKAQHESAKAEIALLNAEKEKLVALIDQAQAQLKVLQLRVEDTVIRAPVAGVVGNRSVREGQLVDPGRFLMAIVPLDNVWVDANFKETQLTYVKVGQEVEVKVDTFPNQPIKGIVASVAPASGAEFSILPPQNASGNFTKIVQRIPVKIAISENDPMIGRLRPGMSSVVSINTKSKPELVDQFARGR